MANVLIGKPAYQAAFVDERGFVSSVWLPWLNSLYLAGGALSIAQTTLTALGAALATDQKNVAALQTLSSAAAAAIALLNAAMAAVASSLMALELIVNAHTLELGLHQARLDALGAATVPGNLTEAVSAVLTITGGIGAVLGPGVTLAVAQASSTASGYLSAVDWNTFHSTSAGAGAGAVNKSVLVNSAGVSDDYQYSLNQPKQITVNGT